ncbi:hypothetical protein TeGR_g9383 [Tetraparma gracilis]|uniref:WW domain-containing protein n=1 Tax=Tetraparma gracilis TaxID=2962635 RepID=A0ABQ6N396_9STRA|nr:hypothetical protein TeGR_g9383 [Tetraparma gracilis]
MPTWTKNAKKFNKKFKIDESKTDVKFIPKVEAPKPKPKADTYQTGFADWQLKSAKFRPPAPEPVHELYRQEVEYETWEEHYDDEGKRFYHNPTTGVSQWDTPALILKAMAADGKRQKKKEIAEFYAYQQQQEALGYGEEEEGYWDEQGNWVAAMQTQQPGLGLHQAQQMQPYDDEGYGDDGYYDEEDGEGYYDEEGNWVDNYDGPKRLGWDGDDDDGVEGGGGKLTRFAGDDGDDDDDDDDDDDPNTPPDTAAAEPSMASDIEKTRARLKGMNFVAKKGSEKKWAMLRGVKNVLSEVNDAGKLHDEDLVREEEIVAVCSLLANETVSIVIDDAVPRIALKIKKERLKAMEEKNHANWKVAHADFKTNKVEVEVELKVGSAAYLEAQVDEEEEESAGGEWDAYEEAKMAKKKKDAQSSSALDTASSVGIDGTDGRTLTKLVDDLENIGVESKKLARILFRLSHSKLGHAPLREIDITNDPIGDVGASCLATLLKTSSIVRMYLVNCSIGNVGTKAISQAALHNRSLMELYLNNNDVTDEGVRDIAVALGSSPTLKTLNLSSNRITEEGAKHIASMLVDPGCRLRSLFLSGRLDTTKQLEAAEDDEDDEEEEGNDAKKKLADKKRRTQSMFTDISAGTLAVLETKRKLAKKKGRIGFMGTIYLATALLAPHGCPLRNLTLVNCDLGPTPEGCKALSVALYGNETLEVLNISDNMIGQVGADYLSEALRVNKKLKNLIARNCGINQETVARLRNGVEKKEELDWIDRKDLARSAVEMRDWMLKIAQQNNFKFANQHVLEAQLEEQKKELDRENALQAEIENTQNKFKKGALKIIKQNVHQHILEKVDEAPTMGGMGMMVSSKSAPVLPTAEKPAASFKGLMKNRRWDDFSDEDIDLLNTCDTAELDAAATRDLLLSCKKLHEASLVCADECSAEIVEVSKVIQTTKEAIIAAELGHREKIASLKARAKEEQKVIDDLKVPMKKLNKDLKPLEEEVRESTVPLEAAKQVLLDLGNKTDREYAEVKKPERGMTMGEAIRDARARTNARGSIMPNSAAAAAKEKAEAEEAEKKKKEPEILKAARNRFDVMFAMTEDLKAQVQAIKSQLSQNVQTEQSCKANMAKLKKEMAASNDEVFQANQKTQEGYSESTKLVLSLQLKLRKSKLTATSMSARLDVLQGEAKKKQKKEDWTGLVKETCFNKAVDDKLRDAIFDEIAAETLLEDKSSMFKEIEANWKFVTSSTDMLEYNLKNLSDKVDEANHKLGLDLPVWKRDANEIAGVGLVPEWKKAKVLWDKVDGKKNKFEKGAYSLEVPEGVMREWEEVRAVFEPLDKEKTEAEEVLKECTSTKIKWEKELVVMKRDRDEFAPVYEQALAELNVVKEDYAHKRLLLATLQHDHMALISAEELRKNPPKTFSSKADQDAKEALVNFAKQFSDEINDASKVVSYHVTMRKIADMSRIRKEQLLLLEKEETKLTKEEFLMKLLRDALGVEHDIEHGSREWRWAMNNLRRKKHLRQQKARSVARKADRDRKRREKLVWRAESMPIKEVMAELRDFGMDIDEIHNEDRLIELHVMCHLHQRIIETGNWGRRSHENKGLLGDGVYVDRKSPIKKKVVAMQELNEWLAQPKLIGKTLEQKLLYRRVEKEKARVAKEEGEREAKEREAKDKEKIKELIADAESMSVGELLKELKEYGMDVANVDDEDKLVEMYVMCALHETIMVTGEFDYERLGKGIYADPSSPTKMRRYGEDLNRVSEISSGRSVKSVSVLLDDHQEQVLKKKKQRRALANILFLKENVRAAARIEVKELLHLNPKKTELMKRLGLLCIDKNPGVEGAALRRRAAMILLERVVLDKKFEDDPTVCRSLADVHFDIWVAEGAKSSPIHLERAKFCWDKCLRHIDVASDPTAWEQTARVHLYLGEYEGALGTLEQLIKNFPRYENLGRVKVRAASLLMTLGRFKEAKGLLYGAMVRGTGTGGFGVLEMTFFAGILHKNWAAKLEEEGGGGEGEEGEGEGEIEEIKRASTAAFKEALQGEGLGEGAGVGEGGLDEVLSQPQVWRYFGDSAITKGLELLAMSIFECGVEANKGQNAALWISLAKSLRKCGKYEDAVDAAKQGLGVGGTGEGGKFNAKQVAGLLVVWENEDHDELYHEEIGLAIGAVMDEYVVYTEKGEGRGGGVDFGGRSKRGTHKDWKGRRKSSALMQKREDKWKLLTMDSDISMISMASGLSGTVGSLSALRQRRGTLTAHEY